MANARAPEPKKSRRPPATTVEGRENQMVSLAVELAEKQLKDGTASAQVISHYIKLGSTRERLEQERLKRENLLLEAKQEQIASGKRVEELYSNALKAMKGYSGQDEDDEEFDYED